MENSRPALLGLSQAEIQAQLGDIKGAKMRAAQIATAIYEAGVATFEEITSLPATLRQELSEKFSISPIQVHSIRESSDGVKKLLVHNGDNQLYECVYLPYSERVSCCLSSQVGCPMGCKFCATGIGGFDRNLEASEIVAQYMALQRLSERRISHLVMMGMGEPLLNLPNVLKALEILHDQLGISYRRMTVSTVGIVPQIRQLAEIGLPIHLALSLHSPLDSVRDKLMPVNHKWQVAEVMQAMKDFGTRTGRKITIEYLLIKDVTDTLDQAKELVKVIGRAPHVVNLIPFNYVDTEQGFARPERRQVQAFKSTLAAAGVNVTERTERGIDIAAACGQLAGMHQGKFARRQPSQGLPMASS